MSTFVCCTSPCIVSCSPFVDLFTTDVPKVSNYCRLCFILEIPDQIVPGVYLEPQTIIYKWLFQLDDEPNLYIGNGWKPPFPSIYTWLFGVPGKNPHQPNRTELPARSWPEHLTHQGAPTTFRGICAMTVLKWCGRMDQGVYLQMFAHFWMACGRNWGRFFGEESQKIKRLFTVNIEQGILWMICFLGGCGWSGA